MPSCFVRGCKSSSYVKKKGKKNQKHSLFRPTTDEALQQWRNAIPGGENLQKGNVVCDLHFCEEDVIQEMKCGTIKTPDGDFSMKRERARLRMGAIPLYFVMPPHENRPPTKPHVINITSKPGVDHSFEDESNFQTILKNLDCIPMPSPLWIVHPVEDLIVWHSWTTGCSDSSRRVVLHSNMTVKIFVGQKKINVDSLQSIGNVKDIIHVLQEVSKFLPCTESDTGRSVDCIGYILQKEEGKPGQQTKFCGPCNKWKISSRDKLRKKKRKGLALKNNNKTMLGKIRNGNRRNKRTAAKVKQLKEKV